jgi:glutathione S-transferase
MTADYYYFPFSYWSRIITLVIEEKGLKPTRHVVDIRKNATFEPDYMRLNPKGVVPTWVEDGQPVCNGPIIARHLEKSGPPLLQLHPQAPRVADLAVKLEAVPLMLFSYSIWVQGKREEKSATILDDKVERAGRYAKKYPALEKLYLRKKKFFEGFRSQVYDDAHVARQKALTESFLEAQIAPALSVAPWLGGADFSFADCILLSMLYRFRDAGILDGWAQDREHPFFGFMERAQQRPSYAAVFLDDPLIPS